MNADKIKLALARVHLYETSSTNKDGVSRVQAYRNAITGSGLTVEECEVLRKALHIQEDELKV